VGQVEVGDVNSAVDLEATMPADLDLLRITVYCTADDLLPAPSPNARRKLTDAEIVTLCVAQVLMGKPSDRRFLKAALNKRRARLLETSTRARRSSRQRGRGCSLLGYQTESALRETTPRMGSLDFAEAS
jgi:hypothetical protein